MFAGEGVIVWREEVVVQHHRAGALLDELPADDAPVRIKPWVTLEAVAVATL